MDLAESLRVIRRRWLVIAAAVVVGLVAGWLTAPGEDAGPAQFRATHTMIINPGGGGGINLEQTALLATTGAVPERVAEGLDLPAGQVRGAVSAEADTQVAVLTITARSPDRDRAEALADRTAEELVVELSGTRVGAYQREVDRLVAQVASARERVTSIQALPGAEDGTDSAAALELQAARSDLSSALQSLQSFEAQGAPEPPLQTVEAASARPVAVDGVQAPASKPARAALLGGFGLVLGLGAALALDRFDTRLHTRRATEDAFGHQVVGEIPPLPRGTDGQLLAVTQPSAAVVEAYRGLRSVVALGAMPLDEGGQDQRVLVVTSPMAGEGKTTTVAHLAATLAEVGRSVLVISADFRRPRVHLYLGIDRDPGLTDALAGGTDDPDLGPLVRETDVPGVFVLPSGPPVENPAAILERLGALLRAGRGLFDHVLVDGPPLLVADDAIALSREADAVLVMARARQTTVAAAERSAELLDRVGVPVAGIVLTATADTATGYRYQYYSEAERDRRPGLRLRSKDGRRRRSAALEATGRAQGDDPTDEDATGPISTRSER